MNIMELIKADIAKAERMLEAGELSLSDVRLMPGNRKTGRSVCTVSLMPVVDCTCAACHGDCYDLLHDVIQNGCRWQRAVNHVLHARDPGAFWKHVFSGLAALERMTPKIALRINVGGDVTAGDLVSIERLARAVRKARVLLFTKNYGGLLKLFDTRDRSVPWPKSLHVVVSRWVCVPVPTIDIKARAPEGFHYIESRVRWLDRMPKCLKGHPDAETVVADNDKVASRLFNCPGDCGICLDGKIGCFNRRLKGVCFDAH